jgi:ribosome-binding protein aMBF1 (putative translation factor)
MRSSNIEADNLLIWIGTGIANRRENAGLTPRQLAHKVRLKTDVIHRLECGEYDMTLRQLYAVAGAVGATLGDILR